MDLNNYLNIAKMIVVKNRPTQNHFSKVSIHNFSGLKKYKKKVYRNVRKNLPWDFWEVSWVGLFLTTTKIVKKSLRKIRKFVVKLRKVVTIQKLYKLVLSKKNRSLKTRGLEKVPHWKSSYSRPIFQPTN